MTDIELETLFYDLESDTVERTSSVRDTDKFGEALCAFANDLPDHRRPGVLFVGVENDGSCSGVEVTDRVLKNLVWIRVGPRRGRASPQNERLLTEKRRYRDQPFDLRAVSWATLEDLDRDLFGSTYLPASVSPDVLAENERDYPQRLSSLRMCSPGVDAMPTIAGLLTVGRDPLRFISGAYVQFLRIDGLELTDPIQDQKVIDGPIPRLIEQLDDVLKANNSVSSDFTSASVELNQPAYPMIAIQQITRNAIMHRVYEGTNAPIRVTWFRDRIEISSPGGPYGNVTTANFGQPGITDYRNPHIAEAMRNLGYVQRFGAGIAQAKLALLRNGNPPIEFQVNASFVLATLRVKSS